MLTGGLLPSSTVRVTVVVPALMPLSVIVPETLMLAKTTLGSSVATISLSGSPSGSTAEYGTSNVSPVPRVCGKIVSMAGGRFALATDTVNAVLTGGLCPSLTLRVTVAVPAPTAFRVIKPCCPSVAATTPGLSDATDSLSGSFSGSITA